MEEKGEEPPTPFLNLIQYQIINNKTTTTSIVINVGLPFNGNPNNFYEELYKNKITYGFIRSELGFSDDVKIKFNGTFKRDLYYIDDNKSICKTSFKIQTAAWMNKLTNKWQYVSIFPCFIKKYCQMSLNLLENICCLTRKGENIFDHIDDPEGLFDCEDPIARPLKRFEKEFKLSDPSALLNSRYAQVYNLSISLNAYNVVPRRFQKVYELILTAIYYFGIDRGVLAITNSILNL